MSNKLHQCEKCKRSGKTIFPLIEKNILWKNWTVFCPGCNHVEISAARFFVIMKWNFINWILRHKNILYRATHRKDI